MNLCYGSRWGSPPFQQLLRNLGNQLAHTYSFTGVCLLLRIPFVVGSLKVGIRIISDMPGKDGDVTCMAGESKVLIVNLSAYSAGWSVRQVARKV